MTAILQALVNGVLAGVLIAVPAMGLSAIFAVLRYVNFAIGALATAGAYTAWMLNAHAAWPVLPAMIAAFTVAAMLGLATETVALKRLRPSGALAVAMASLAVGVILENAIRFLFGNDLRAFDLPLSRDWRFEGLRIGPQQLRTGLIALAVMASVFAFLRYTRYGKAIRAVADNPDLGRLMGMSPDRIALATVALGAGLAGAGGALLGLDSAIDPMTGTRLLLPIFAAAVLGGLGSIPGALLGAVLIGIGEEMALLVIPPTYRSAVGFITILVVLSFRPGGLFGEKVT